MNNSNENNNISDSSSISTPIIATMTLLSAVITVFNAVFIILYMRSAKVRRNISIFILNLAIVDFNNGALSLPLNAALPRQDADTLHPAACVFVLNVPIVLATVGFLTVLLVSLERIVVLLRPFHHHQVITRARCLLTISVVWLASFVFNFMMGSASVLPLREPYALSCKGFYVYSTAQVYSFVYVVIVIPVVIICVIYARIFLLARSHARAIAVATQSASGDSNMHNSRSHPAGSKAAKMAFLVTVIYLICWVPFCIVIQLSQLCLLGECVMNTTMSKLNTFVATTAVLAFLNSLINPLIYAFKNSVVKSELRKMLPTSCSPLFKGKNEESMDGDEQTMTRVTVIKVKDASG